jgi:hypothetical protein
LDFFWCGFFAVRHNELQILPLRHRGHGGKAYPQMAQMAQISTLQIEFYSKWQEYFSQSAQRSQRKSKALAFI